MLKGSNVPAPQLSLPVLAGKQGENWFCVYIKVQYTFHARNSFSLLHILLALSLSDDSHDVLSVWPPVPRQCAVSVDNN